MASSKTKSDEGDHISWVTIFLMLCFSALLTWERASCAVCPVTLHDEGDFGMPLNLTATPFAANVFSFCWLLTVPEPWPLLLYWNTFELWNGEYATIYDGNTTDARVIFQALTSSHSSQVLSSASQVLVDFHASSARQTVPSNKVFSASFFSLGSYQMSSSTSVNSVLGMKSNCNYVLTSSDGSFSMPETPFSTSSIQNCKWLIQAADSLSHISLSFQKFNPKSGQFVQIFDGSTEQAASLGRFDLDAHNVTSTSNFMLVTFSAGYDQPHSTYWTAFQAVFTTHKLCSSGEIFCGSEDNQCYRSEQRCNYHWDCPSGADEAGCYGCTLDRYRCGPDEAVCFSKHDWCTGSNICRSYADENNCNHKQCAAEQSLFLCTNKRCILRGWQCDGTNDCGDNSDEIDCKQSSTRKVVIAAVVGSLMCSLLLVVVLGCTYKVYYLRMREQRHQETPLGRMQAEMFRRRAPPPPYHEAMLTSRPYNEAVREFTVYAQRSLQSVSQECAFGHHHLANHVNYDNAIRSPEQSSLITPSQAERRTTDRLVQHQSSHPDSDIIEAGSVHMDGATEAASVQSLWQTENNGNEETVSLDSAFAIQSANETDSLCKETDSDACLQDDSDSVCILCLDHPPDLLQDDGSDTQCLLLLQEL